MDKKLIGVDLGGTTTKFAILTVEGDIQQRWSIDTNVLDEGAHIIPDIIESINHHMKLYDMTADQFAGIGMGSPGTVDRKLGTVIGAYNLNWKTLQQAKKEIEAGTGIEFAIDNDANVAALGERWKGAGENDDNVAFVTLGTGVGGGIIADGHLLHGTAGSAGEIGHITVDPKGYLCTCGKHGCLETVASATGVVRVARDMAEEYAGTSQLKQILDDGNEISSKITFDLAKQGDPLAKMVVDKVAKYLGIALGNVGNTLNPAFIVIGGGVSAAGTFLLDQVQAYFDEYTFPQVRETTKLKLAELGNVAGVIGAASLALEFV
ncbi:ROK family glucokinase [Loigolactobacillus coryniformis]|jgi:glucokinase|uniref:Glucokinase n=4 Tax=Loigolactobacillus coryniformis TaxID=1610 RepID=J2Z7L5_9LACO|nr:ROK family glucokinase [Loigolactobacillus coryniformis]MDT3391299.1 ROK family glucokinase [Bacillota bacterium]OEH90758.1 glucokinase [Loigolactobacillus coryniformis subsp. coryniformis]RRG06352.1 MAG: ROK family protein [Lactobacillus sp.]ATO44012.1 glucokinase [Loigolactobacillus coryniformis subsp. torquens DSM 20004 = KCTC 3535]ATO55687.1 glucokinase [Loigolactobacillus coryniformis subsp. coryniformis KCTC 3167 = DSM 20001]